MINNRILIPRKTRTIHRAQKHSGNKNAAGQSGRNSAECRRKFLHYFPEGFYDETYLKWERNYKVTAHEKWNELLDEVQYKALLRNRKYDEIAKRAVGIESRTNLLFSFEKMALRDAVRSAAGARTFATALYDFVHGPESIRMKFERWSDVVAALPRKQTRVLTWPMVTVFGFIARPKLHIFLKPNVTRIAARTYGFDFTYQSKPNWETYANLLEFGDLLKTDLKDLRPRDMIDIQSFIWLLGSDEYPDI